MAIRTCIGCRKACDKTELVRLVLQDCKVSVDLPGKKKGRGAHVHVNISCVKKALNDKLLAHKLRYRQAAGSDRPLDLRELKEFFCELIAAGKE